MTERPTDQTPVAATSGTELRATVVIPHYQDVVRLHRCLDSLMPQCNGAGVEVIVVDNGSADDLSALLAKYPGMCLVVEPTKGAAAARNRGVAETRAPLLFFLDCDCVPADDWIATALSLPLSGALVGGRVDVFDETPKPRSGAEAFETVFAFRQKMYVEQQQFSVTANLVTTRAIFEDVGGFRGGVSEDNDWCHRAIAKGYTLRYCEALAVAHPTRSDWSALKRKWQRTCAENFLRHGTNASARVQWAGRAIVVLISGFAHMPKVLTHPVLAPREKCAGALTLVRLRASRAIWMLTQAISGRA